MAGQDIWWSYWYFHLPNYVFAVLFYTLFGRFALSLFLPPNSPNYIYRWFCRLTDWFMGPVALITPRALPAFLLPPVAAFWIVIIRLAFNAFMLSTGMNPPMPAPAT